MKKWLILTVFSFSCFILSAPVLADFGLIHAIGGEVNENNAWDGANVDPTPKCTEINSYWDKKLGKCVPGKAPVHICKKRIQLGFGGACGFAVCKTPPSCYDENGQYAPRKCILGVPCGFFPGGGNEDQKKYKNLVCKHMGNKCPKTQQELQNLIKNYHD